MKETATAQPGPNSSRTRLGRGPPARNFTKLTARADLRNQCATSKDGVAQVTAAAAEPKKAVQELLTLLKVASRELKQSVTAAKKAFEHQQGVRIRGPRAQPGQPAGGGAGAVAPSQPCA
eukprot:8922917-Alexandrium_andersonii.AAC.1